MSPEDVAARLLELAAGEGALAPERLADVARGLSERSERLIAERIEPLEAQAAEQAAELAWRTQLQQSLENEVRWLRETLAGQAAELIWRREAMDGSEAELRWHRANAAGVASEVAQARSDRDAAGQAHDRLLEHHRSVAREMADRLEALAGVVPKRAAAAHAELRSLAAGLRAEAGE